MSLSTWTVLRSARAWGRSADQAIERSRQPHVEWHQVARRGVEEFPEPGPTPDNAGSWRIVHTMTVEAESQQEALRLSEVSALDAWETVAYPPPPRGGSDDLPAAVVACACRALEVLVESLDPEDPDARVYATNLGRAWDDLFDRDFQAWSVKLAIEALTKVSQTPNLSEIVALGGAHNVPETLQLLELYYPYAEKRDSKAFSEMMKNMPRG